MLRSKRFREKRLRLMQKGHRKRAEPGFECTAFFNAQTSYGALGLEASLKLEAMNPGVPPGDALHALVLGVVESKIQFVENWLRCFVDIRPGKPEHDQYAKLFTLRDTDQWGSQITVYLPVGSWRLIPMLPEALLSEGWEMVWCRYGATIILSQLLLTPDEQSAINLDSLIILPESFLEPWQAIVNIPSLSLTLPVSLDRHKFEWVGEGALKAVSSAVQPVESMKRTVLEFVKDEPTGLQVSGQSSKPDSEPTCDPISVQEIEPVNTPNELISGQISHALTLCSSLLAHNAPAYRLPVGESGWVNTVVSVTLSTGQHWSGHLGPIAGGYALFITRQHAA